LITEHFRLFHADDLLAFIVTADDFRTLSPAEIWPACQTRIRQSVVRVPLTILVMTLAK
jgi:hypothetical protein